MTEKNNQLRSESKTVKIMTFKRSQNGPKLAESGHAATETHCSEELGMSQVVLPAFERVYLAQTKPLDI